MEFLKQWTFCVCVTLIVATVLSQLTPKGRMSRFYKIILSVFIFVSFLYPIKGFDVDNIYFDNSNILVTQQDTQEATYQYMISQKLKALLADEGISPASVNVKTETKNNEIEITDVQIAITSDYDKDQVKQLVFSKLGINARVIYNGE